MRSHVKIILTNNQGERQQIVVQDGQQMHVMAKDHDTIELVNAQTGQPIKHLLVEREGNDLVIRTTAHDHYEVIVDNYYLTPDIKVISGHGHYAIPQMAYENTTENIPLLADQVSHDTPFLVADDVADHSAVGMAAMAIGSMSVVAAGAALALNNQHHAPHPITTPPTPPAPPTPPTPPLVPITPSNHAPTGSLSIVGNNQEGQTLTIDNQIKDADGINTSSIKYQWTADGQPIVGATADNYTITSNEVGKKIGVTVSYDDNAGNHENVTTVNVSSVSAMDHMPTGDVTISGKIAEGETLNAHNTIKDANGIDHSPITYHWLADGHEVATGDSYTLTANDVDKAISVKATYTDNQGFNDEISSSATTPVEHTNHSPTKITLNNTSIDENNPVDTVIGKLSTTDPDTMDHKFTYSVSDHKFDVDSKGNLIAKQAFNFEASSQEHVVVTTDDGHGGTYSQDITITINNVNEGSTTPIAIVGTPKVGNTLVLSGGIDDPDGNPSSFIYKWQTTDGIDLGTGTQIVVPASAEGKQITVSSEYKDNAGFDNTLTSAPTSAVAKADMSSGNSATNHPPTDITLAGSHHVAENDKGASIGKLSTTDQDAGDTFTYAVSDPRFTVDSSGFLKLKPEESLDYEKTTGHQVSLNITSTDSHGKSVPKAFTIHIDDMNEQSPTGLDIKGKLEVGQTLTVDNQINDPDGNPSSFNYIWKADSKEVGKGDSYTLTANDAGKKITVETSFQDAHHNNEFSISDESNAVAPAPVAPPPAHASSSLLAINTPAHSVNSGETLHLTGTSKGLADGTAITVTVGGKEFHTTITHDKWQVDVDLTGLSGTQNISAHTDDSTNISSSTVSTTVENPAPNVTLSIDHDSQDKLLLTDSGWKVTGTSKGLPANSAVELNVNNHIYYGTTDAHGKWSVQVDKTGLDSLKEDTKTDYQVTAQDNNNHTASANGHVTLDKEFDGKVVMDPVTGDNVVTQAEKDAGFKLTGHIDNLTHYEPSTGYPAIIKIDGVAISKPYLSINKPNWDLSLPSNITKVLKPGEHTITYGFTDGIHDKSGQVYHLTEFNQHFTVQAPASTEAKFTIDDIKDNGILNAHAHSQDLSITGTAENVKDIVISLNGKEYHQSDLTISGSHWTLNIAKADVANLENLHSYVIDGHAKANSDSHDIHARNGLSVMTDKILTIDPATGDNILSSQDKSHNLQLHGLANNFADGEVLHINFNGQTYTTQVNGETWSITLPQTALASLQDGQTYHLDVKASDGTQNSTDIIIHNNDAGMTTATSGDISLAEAKTLWHLIQHNDYLDSSLPDVTKVHMKLNDPHGVNTADAMATLPNVETTEHLLTALNALRSYNHLDPVNISPDLSMAYDMQKGIIAMGQEGTIGHWLSHTSEQNLNKFKHYDEDGAFATGSGVIGFEGGADNQITGYVLDDDNAHPNVGHRAQLIDPQLAHTAIGAGIGHVTGYGNTPVYYHGLTTLERGKYNGKLINHQYVTPQTSEWPGAGYVPFALVPTQLWSFAVQDSAMGDNVKITVTLNSSDGSHKQMTVNNISTASTQYQTSHVYDHLYTFHVDGVQKPTGDNIDTYHVDIESKDTHHHWAYDVKVFDESDSAFRSAHLVPANDAPKVLVSANTEHINIDGHDIASNEVLSLDDNGHHITVTGQAHSNLSTGNGDDVLVVTGSLADHQQINTQAGNDQVSIHETAEHTQVNLGSGDDQLSIDRYMGGDFDGGAGHNTFTFTGGANVVNLEHFKHFDTIDLGTHHNTPNVLNINANDLLDNQDSSSHLWITGGTGNVVSLSGGTVVAQNAIEHNGQTFHDISYQTNSGISHIMIADTLYHNGEGLSLL